MHVNLIIPGSFFFFFKWANYQQYTINACISAQSSDLELDCFSQLEFLITAESTLSAQQSSYSLSRMLDIKSSASNCLVGWGTKTLQRTDKEKRFKILFHLKWPLCVTSKKETGYEINVFAHPTGYVIESWRRTLKLCPRKATTLQNTSA